MNHPLKHLLARLLNHISARRKKQFALLSVLMILASFAEVVSIGAVLPFIGMLTAPQQVFHHPYSQPIVQMLGLTEPRQLLLPFTIAFSLATLSAGGIRLFLLWASTRLAFAIGAEISFEMYLRTLYQPYSVHCSKNSGEIISAISVKANAIIYTTIVPILTIISSVFMLFTILTTLLLIDPFVVAAALFGFGIIYSVIIKWTNKQIQTDGECIARESDNLIKSLQEGLSAIRDILINGTQKLYGRKYQDADLPLRRAQGNTIFVSSSPRFILESCGMVLIAILAYSLAQRANGLSSAIPILSVLAVGAQRLLPVMQQTYSSWVNIKSGKASLADTLDLLDQPIPDYANEVEAMPLSFKSDITLKKMGFCYEKNSPYVLKNINLKIKQGDRVGFIGTSGSGKSTLVDILMGLLQPTVGEFQIDGQNINEKNVRSWQANISHVPQSIFLADRSIAENIAFGVPKPLINMELVRNSAELAQLAETIDGWPEKYQTQVGERGARLSGGQLQRIGIARALYKQAKVIILDEATSSLDSKTENSVMKSIINLKTDLTILIIAHRVTTLKNCDQIIELEKGSIKRIVSFEEIIQKPHKKAKR